MQKIEFRPESMQKLMTRTNLLEAEGHSLGRNLVKPHVGHCVREGVGKYSQERASLLRTIRTRVLHQDVAQLSGNLQPTVCMRQLGFRLP